MATVYERFNSLGFASSNTILTKVGVTVHNNFYNTHTKADELIKFKSQTEHDSRHFIVNDYPDDWTAEIDKIILSFVNSNANG